jgi:hypothetical protein
MVTTGPSVAKALAYTALILWLLLTLCLSIINTNVTRFLTIS